MTSTGSLRRSRRVTEAEFTPDDHHRHNMKRVQTLGDAPVGKAARIRYIFFEGLRAECERLGLREGLLVQLRERTDSAVVVGCAEGRSILLDRSSARFIAVEPM
ncbi:MAG: hypothetical protein GEU90_21395 [Gemmatimonas sp.]|nr:hypothetical protein [Gemmatimonas sp.]